MRDIAARSRRQAMEWALALASQGIEPIIDHTEEGWKLLVEDHEHERAESTIAQYRLENRGWRWKQPVPLGGTLFHWGSAGWVAAIGAFYYWSTVRCPAAEDLGIIDTEKVARGEWWRLFTAVTLHENIPHLAANSSTGFVLLGLAMARFGGGVALLASFLAGVLGNGASVVFGSGPHESLGASGMVTGALGLLTAQSYWFWRRFRQGRQFLFRAAAAGGLILVLIGFSPGADIAAHVGGFVAGAFFGAVLGRVRAVTQRRPAVNAASLLTLAALVAATWVAALRK